MLDIMNRTGRVVGQAFAISGVSLGGEQPKRNLTRWRQRTRRP